MSGAKILVYHTSHVLCVYLVGIGPGNPGMQGPGDDRRGRDFDERAGKCVLLVSELNPEVIINRVLMFLCIAYLVKQRYVIIVHKKHGILQ